jgi:hypothetical protein
LLYYVCIVLMRVDEQATKDSEVQLVETAEQELVEGKLCPWSLLLPIYVFINHNDLHRLILLGRWDPIGYPRFWLSLYLVSPLVLLLNFWVVHAIALRGFGYRDIHHSFLYLLLSVHDKIIMLMGTWRTTRENSATTRV